MQSLQRNIRVSQKQTKSWRIIFINLVKHLGGVVKAPVQYRKNFSEVDRSQISGHPRDMSCKCKNKDPNIY